MIFSYLHEAVWFSIGHSRSFKDLDQSNSSHCFDSGLQPMSCRAMKAHWNLLAMPVNFWAQWPLMLTNNLRRFNVSLLRNGWRIHRGLVFLLIQHSIGNGPLDWRSVSTRCCGSKSLPSFGLSTIRNLWNQFGAD